MEHAKHVVRAVLLLVLACLAFVVIRYFAIPDSFGQAGAYRFDSIAEHVARPLVHGPPGACGECHDDEHEALAQGKHHAVSCEVCHAPLDVHVRGGEVIAEMPAQRSYKLCATCHERLVARPTDFPQIVPVDHVTEQGSTMSETVCWECHENAHNPTGE